MRTSDTATDVERAVVGCCLIDPGSALEAARTLEGWEITDRSCREIFAAVRSLALSDLPVDKVTVADTLATTGRLGFAGGVDTLDTLAAFALTSCTPSHLPAYLESIRQRARLHRIRLAASQVASITDGPKDTQGAIDRAARIIENALSDGASTTLQSMSEVALTTAGIITSREHGAIPGISTGLTALDRLTGGLRPGQLALLAGRAKIGKTAVAGHIALHTARAGHAVLIATLEMSPWQWQLRWVASSIGIAYARLVKEQITPEEANLARAALALIAGLPIHFISDRSLSLMDLRAEAATVARQQPLALLVVDHLGLLADVLRGNDAVRDLGHVTKRLRDLAQKVDVSVLALSQLNRGVEQRASKRPHLHDLRASGELEQDADLVVLVYRDSYYYPAGTPIDADTGEVARGTSRHVYRVDPHLAELIVAANRDGPPGSALIHFNPTTMTIADISSGPDNHPILR